MARQPWWTTISDNPKSQQLTAVDGQAALVDGHERSGTGGVQHHTGTGQIEDVRQAAAQDGVADPCGRVVVHLGRLPVEPKSVVVVHGT